MPIRTLMRPVLLDEAMTRGLCDPEARLLIEWLVDYGELLLGRGLTIEEAEPLVADRWRRGRAIARFVEWWCYRGARKSALQLAAAEGVDWTLPVGRIDPMVLMQELLDCEGDEPRVPGDW